MRLRLFPYLKDKYRIDQLQIDKESIHYITIRENAIQIAEIINQNVGKLNKKCKSLTITDATAGVGGDTLTLAKYFNKVISIEVNKTRCDYLKNNVKVYGYTNVNIFHDDCKDIIFKIPHHDIIYIDPPWEPDGHSYKEHSTLRLPFCNMPLEKFCNSLWLSPMLSVPSLIVLKLPKNYDMDYFNENIINKIIYYYDLGKMIILVLKNNNIL